MSSGLDPIQTLAALCQRHGLDPSRGQDLLPLVERALTARESVRRQALQLVDKTLARRAVERSASADDQRLLALLAGLLHDWGQGAA